MDKIVQFLESQPRNKIVFHKLKMTDLKTLNLGFQMAEAIYSYKDVGKVSMKATSTLGTLLNASVAAHTVYGPYLSIENPGILFEPELKLDFANILDRHSQNNLLFVHWEGDIDQDYLYFLTRESGIKINIKHLSYITI